MSRPREPDVVRHRITRVHCLKELSFNKARINAELNMLQYDRFRSALKIGKAGKSAARIVLYSE